MYWSENGLSCRNVLLSVSIDILRLSSIEWCVFFVDWNKYHIFWVVFTDRVSRLENHVKMLKKKGKYLKVYAYILLIRWSIFVKVKFKKKVKNIQALKMLYTVPYLSLFLYWAACLNTWTPNKYFFFAHS